MGELPTKEVSICIQSEWKNIFQNYSCSTSGNYDADSNVSHTNDDFWEDVDMFNSQVAEELVVPEVSVTSPVDNFRAREGRASSTLSSTQSSTLSSTPQHRKRTEPQEKYENFLAELVKKVGNDPPPLDGCDNFFIALSANVKNYNLTASQLANLQCKVMLYVTKCLEEIKQNDSI